MGALISPFVGRRRLSYSRRRFRGDVQIQHAGEVRQVSDKEQRILQLVSELPPEIQDRFLDRLEGAALALEALGANFAAAAAGKR